MAYGSLVPHPGIKPGPLAERAQNPNHWPAKEFPPLLIEVTRILFQCYLISPIVLLLKKKKQTTEDFYREHPYTHRLDSTMNMLLYTCLSFYSPVPLVTFQNKWQASLQYPLDIIRI